MLDLETDNIETLQQLGRAARRAESMHRVIESISGELALEPLLTRIVESAVELLDAQYGSIGLVVETTNGPGIRIAAIYNMPPEELSAIMLPGVGLAGRVLRDQQPLILARYGDLEHLVLPDLAEHAVIGLPIWWGEHMIGFFGIGVEPPGHFDEQDAETLALFARHAAIAIENARRFETERRRAARMAAINRIGQLIASRLSLDELLQTVVEALHEHLGYLNIALLLVDLHEPDTLVLRARGGIYTASDIGEYRQQINQGIIGAAVQARQRLLIPNVRNDPRYIPVPGAAHIHSELAVPILAADRVLGALNIETEQPIGDEDADSVQTIADQLGIAIDNARLFAAEQRRAARIAIINRIGRLITSSLSLDVIFQTAVEAIYEQLSFAYVAAGVVDPDDPEMLMLLAHAGAYVERLPPDYRQSIYVGIIGEVARTRRRVLVENVANDPRYLPVLQASEIRAELVVPIMAGDELLGILNIETTQSFVAEDIDGVEAIADQLGIAMVNARRYEAEKQRTERLGLIASLGQRIAARLDPEELYTATVEELHWRLGYDHVALFLIDPADPNWLVQRSRASRWPRGEAIGYRQSIEQGILGAAAQKRAPQLVNDVTVEPRFIAVPNADEMRAELAMPILHGDRLFGVLDVAGVRRFQQEDVTAIQIIADQLSVAIDHAALFGRTQRALAETQLLYETSRRISTAMSVDAVIEVYLEQVAARGRYACTVALYEMNDAGQRIAVNVVGFWSAQTGLNLEKIRLPYTYDDLDPPLDAGQTVAIVNVHTDPRVSEELRQMQIRDQRPALAMIPLMVGSMRIGLVVLSYPYVHDWSEADLRLYQVSAVQLAAALDSRQQHLLLSQRGQQLAVLEERRRLARELHDSVTQSLFSMSLLTQVLPDLWDIDQTEARAGLLQVRDLTRSALAEMRALLFELRPAALSQHDLTQAIRGHVANFEQRTGVPVTFTVTGKIACSEAVDEALFRIAQEALANVARHAHARSVRITLSAGPPLRLTIADDGQGFQTEHVAEGRFGLVSIRERAAKIGAGLHIRSAIGQGTELVIEL